MAVSRRLAAAAILAAGLVVGLAIFSRPLTGPRQQRVEAALIPADLSVLVNNAELIVRGVVTSTRTEIVSDDSARQNYVVSIWSLNTKRTYFGRVSDRFEVETLGGSTDALLTVSDEQAQLALGMDVVLFLGRAPTGRLTPWGGFQGAAKVEQDGTLSTSKPVLWKASDLASLEDQLRPLLPAR
jgi:hypothetical protein